MNMRTTAVIAAVAAPVLSASLASAAHACAAEVFRGPLVDLSATTPDPFGDASAKLVMTSLDDGGTRFHLKIRGIDTGARRPDLRRPSARRPVRGRQRRRGRTALQRLDRDSAGGQRHHRGVARRHRHGAGQGIGAYDGALQPHAR